MKIFSVITLCLLICAAFSHADLMEGLVLYMPLDEGSGTATQDLSANGFEGEVMGNANGLTDSSGRHSNLRLPQIMSSLKTIPPFILKARSHKPPGCSWTGCQAHTPSSAALGRVVQLGISVLDSV